MVHKAIGGKQVDVGVVADIPAAAGELEVVTIHVSHVAERLINPVDIGIIEWIASVLVRLNDGIAIDCLATLIAIRLVDSVGVSGSINKLRLVSHQLELVIIGEADVALVEVTMLGGDEDDTIGTLVSIDGGSGCILENGYRFNVIGYHIVDAAFDTIDEDERGTATEALESTHIERGICGIVEARSLKGDETIALANQVIADIAGTATIDILVRNDTYRSCGVLTGESTRGTHIDALILVGDRVNDVILGHRRQAQTCKQCQCNNIICLHIE